MNQAEQIRRKRIMQGLLFLLVLLSLPGCASSGKDSFTIQPLLDSGFQVETVNVMIPNCQREYHLLFLSDLHLIVVNDEVADDSIELVQARLNDWNSPQLWETLPGLLDDCHADMLLFGGDMIDFCSTASFNLLKDGLSKLNTGYMYVRADHDTQGFWQKDKDQQKRKALHDSLPENTDVMVKEFPDFILLGINNSTSQLTEEGLQFCQVADRQASGNRPVSEGQCQSGKHVWMLKAV